MFLQYIFHIRVKASCQAYVMALRRFLYVSGGISNFLVTIIRSSLSDHLYQIVCIRLSLSDHLYHIIIIRLSLSSHLHQTIFIKS